MTPFIRGMLLPEIQSSGRVKARFDVLLWLRKVADYDVRILNQLAILQENLAALQVPWSIRLHVPRSLNQIRTSLTAISINIDVVDEPPDGVETAPFSGAPPDLSVALQIARTCDADLIVADSAQWFAYAPEVDRLNLLLADTRMLQHYCELFVRGHDVPWSFEHMTWGPTTWATFYQLAEPNTFRPGSELMDQLQPSPEAYEHVRSFVHNRLPNICFTRDRLLFFQFQQAAARRAGWTHQDFAFEIGYFLTFYYLLLFGAFDHLAVIVNSVLRLGVPQLKVGVMSRDFLSALEKRDPRIHALFTNSRFVSFLKQTAAVRHYVAHRGSIAPAKIYRRPEAEPTDQELDAELSRRGRDRTWRFMPKVIANWSRSVARALLRVEMSEQLADGVISATIDGEHYFIQPLNDIDWNFLKLIRFQRDLISQMTTTL